MMVSTAACSTCWIVIAIALGISAHGGNQYKLGIVAVSFFVFFTSSGMGVLGVPWLYPTEINVLEVRTKGVSLAMVSIPLFYNSVSNEVHSYFRIFRIVSNISLELRGRTGHVTRY